MNTAYTQDNLAAASELCHAMPSTAPDKALLASMMTEAFINGMTAHERFMTSGPEQQDRR